MTAPSTVPPPSFALGTRLQVSDQRCTVRYAGSLPGTTPEGLPWLGVEWDDPSRGKHDGTHERVSYFSCSKPGAGSFLRPTSNKIQRPRPFLEVLLERYTAPDDAVLPTAPSSLSAAPDGTQAPSTSTPNIVLGGTAIQVVAPNLSKVRARLGRVPALRDIGADDARVGFLGDGEEEEMRAMGPWQTRRLNLSKSLVSRWEDVNAIIEPLAALEALDLTSNRFSFLPPPPERLSAFARLTELNLTATAIPLTTLLNLEPSLTGLQILTLASNNFTSFELPSSLSSDGTRTEPGSSPSIQRRGKWFPNLVELRLDWNELDDWSRLGFLGELTGLRYLSLSNNRLPSLPLPPSNTSSSSPQFSFALPPKLETLHLARNCIDAWPTLSLLASRLHSLRVLWLGGNPLTTTASASKRGPGEELSEEEEKLERRQVRDIRAGVIARMRALAVLDGSEITAGERRAAEIDFVTAQPPEFCAPSSTNAATVGRARWDELVARYGAAEEFAEDGSRFEQRKPSAPVLKDKLIYITFLLPAPSTPGIASLRFLPSTPLRVLLIKLSKHLDNSLVPAEALRSGRLRVFRVPDAEGEDGEELEGPKRTLKDFGLEDGTTLRVAIDG